MSLGTAHAAPHAVFVTGTDTEIGKTCVSAALLRVCARRGLRAAGIKLVAAGMDEIDGRWINEDVATLKAASSVALSDAESGPVQLRTACAPHLAALREGVPLERGGFRAHVQRMATRAQVLVIEGVGGFCVPMSAPDAEPRWGMNDVAADLALPVVLVVGLRLGALNHALLSAQAISAQGLKLAGWVCNRIDPAMPLADENLATLKAWLPAPCLGDVPHLDDPHPEAVADALDTDAVLRTLNL
jgi:dethiobiotin synthetase